MYVQGGRLAYEIQYWAAGASTWPSGFKPQPKTTPWLPCWSNDYYLSAPFAAINGDTLPRDSQLKIALATNRVGEVTKVTFTYTDPDDTGHSAEFDPPAVHPIVACELNFVGPGGSRHANFTQGLTKSRGVIYYSVSSGQLSVQNEGPGAACGEAGYFTAETSNMTYGAISHAPATTVTQILQQPIACAGDTLFGADRTRVDQLQQVRDSHVAQYPAGQWLLEILDRHSADLAVLLASDGSEVARIARQLLTEAANTAREGRVFDEKTVDAALELLGRASSMLPPSMNGAAQAGETLLRSLRGNTLDDGLKVASTTILPRFRAPNRRTDESAQHL